MPFLDRRRGHHYRNTMSQPDEQITIDLYKPSDVQAEAHACRTGDFTELLYGGTAFSGKSLFLWWDPIITQVFREHERFVEYRRKGIDWRSRGWHLHLRRTFKMLKETIARLGEIIPKIDPGAHWSGEDHMWTFTCGYRYEFGHMENEDDWRMYDSRNLSSASFDEVIQTLKVQYDGIYQRVRSMDPELRQNLRLTSASNPDAPAEGVWVRERFVDPAPQGRKLLVDTVTTFDGSEVERARIYVPARITDNPDEQARKDYEVTLRQLPHHVMLARLMGDWNVIEGAFFAWEWKPEYHVVKPYAIPDNWTKFRCIDWGYKRACPVYHVAVDPDNNLIFYRETTYNHELKDEKYRRDAELVALSIREEEMKHGEWDDRRDISAITGPDDPKMRTNDGRVGVSIEETMESHGVYWDTGSKDIAGAVAELVRRLRDIPKDRKQRPGITFFDTCHEFIKRIGTIPTDKNDPEMPEHGGLHHWLDAVLCGCMYRAAKTAHTTSPRPTDHPDIDADDELSRARMRGRRSLGGFRQFAR